MPDINPDRSKAMKMMGSYDFAKEGEAASPNLYRDLDPAR
jgi:hypothetical protein